MSRPAYRGLSIALRILSILLAVGGLLMIFSSRLPRLRVLMYPPESEVSTLLLFLVKELGGLMLMLCVMLWLAARDHARNVWLSSMVLLWGSASSPLLPCSQSRCWVSANSIPYMSWGRSLERSRWR
jgi:nitrate reductase gamma subunit